MAAVAATVMLFMALPVGIVYFIWQHFAHQRMLDR
jgi:hypothetical protein